MNIKAKNITTCHLYFTSTYNNTYIIMLYMYYNQIQDND